MLVLVITLAVLATLAFAQLLRERRDLRRLDARLGRADAEAAASIGVDSFGAADSIAARFYRMRTESNRRLAAAEWQNTLLQRIINGVGEGVVAIDRQRHIVLANRRFADMFNLGAGIVGQPLGDIVRIAAVFAGFDRALGHAEGAERFRVGERTFEMRAFPLPSDEIAAVALFIDVTRIERLEQVRREFLSDFSHEARTPLAGLRSAVETYDAGHVTEEEDQQLRRIMARQLARLERLVDDLSELTRIESGDLRLEIADVDLRALIDDLCEDFAERAAQKQLAFVVRGGENVRVRGDAVRLQQAFANLIDNAIKYGGSRSTIDITIDETSVAITDHGEGIPSEDRERIFNRLYRVDKSRTAVGSGLGLAIARHLILLHGGSIEVASELGRGATFRVRLAR